MTLKGDAPTVINVNKRLADSYLKLVNPAIAVISAENPVKLTVEQQGFRVPIKNYAIDKVNAGGKVELGTLVVEAKSEALKVLPMIMKFVGRDTSLGDTLHAQFTPMNLKVTNGVVHYSDMKMTLVETGTAMLFTGDVNLTNNRIDLTMSILGSSFSGFKQVSSYIGPNDTIDLPITGTISNPRLDVAKLAPSLAKLGLKAGLSQY